MEFPDAQIVGPATHDEIDQFLQEWKPSAQKQAPQGWIWCHLAQATNEQVEKPAEDKEDKDEGFLGKGLELVDKLVATCREIKETAPTRAKKGEKSQKQLREEAHAEFSKDVETLARKSKVLSGKWLFFPAPENVDLVWNKIVRAIADADGELSKTGVVKTAKVAPTSLDGGPQVICVYVNDSWDKSAVRKAHRCLVTELQLHPSAYKCDAFTILGIDSKHETGIKSSLWSNSDFMTRDEIEAALAANRPGGGGGGGGGSGGGGGGGGRGGGAKEPKKKTLEEEKQSGMGDFDDVSESEDDDEPVQKKQKTK